MLPEFLVNLGEELNQSIPTSLSEQIHLSKTSRRTPSPALSSKTLSVQSITSQQEVIVNDNQRSTRDLRFSLRLFKIIRFALTLIKSH